MNPDAPALLASQVQLTFLKPDGSRQELENQCREAIQFGLHGVCVPGSRVTDARHFLEDSALKVACAIGYPFGTSDADAKRYEIEAAVDAGAQEIELVPSFVRLLDG